MSLQRSSSPLSSESKSKGGYRRSLRALLLHQGVWSIGMAKFFPQDAGNSDENRTVLACLLLGQPAVFTPTAASSGQGKRGAGQAGKRTGRGGREKAQANMLHGSKSLPLLRGKRCRYDRNGVRGVLFARP